MMPDPASLSIVSFPHECLKRRADPVDPSDPAVAAVAARMIELMHEANGVGLAAPQVGLPWRLFVTHARDADPVDRVFINPVLSLGRGQIDIEEEGCLSLPGIHVQVRRAVHVRVEATDIEGQPLSLDLDGFPARVVQHEFDHLEGILIIDRMGPLDRLALRRTIAELKAAGR